MTGRSHPVSIHATLGEGQVHAVVETAGAERPRGRGGWQTRRRILAAARRLFSRYGYQNTRLEDIAKDVGLSRAGVLRHFPSKDDLFVEVHRTAVLSAKSYLDAPQHVVDGGFFEILRYWWSSREHLTADRDESERSRIEIIGKYATELSLQERVSTIWLTEDPNKTLDLVDLGIARGEIPATVNPYHVAAVIDWMADGLRASLRTTELDRWRLFHRTDGAAELAQDGIVEIMLAMLRDGLSNASIDGVAIA